MRATKAMLFRRQVTKGNKIIRAIYRNPDTSLPFSDATPIYHYGKPDRLGYILERRGNGWRNIVKYLPLHRCGRSLVGVTVGVYRDLARGHDR